VVAAFSNAGRKVNLGWNEIRLKKAFFAGTEVPVSSIKSANFAIKEPHRCRKYCYYGQFWAQVVVFVPC